MRNQNKIYLNKNQFAINIYQEKIHNFQRVFLNLLIDYKISYIRYVRY